MKLDQVSQKYAEEIAALRLRRPIERRYSRELRRHIVDLYRKGASFDDLFNNFACSRQAVERWCADNSSKQRKTKFLPLQKIMAPQNSPVSSPSREILVRTQSGLDLKISY